MLAREILEISAKRSKEEFKVIWFGDTFNQNENVNVVLEKFYDNLK